MLAGSVFPPIDKFTRRRSSTPWRNVERHGDKARKYLLLMELQDRSGPTSCRLAGASARCTASSERLPKECEVDDANSRHPPRAGAKSSTGYPHAPGACVTPDIGADCASARENLHDSAATTKTVCYRARAFSSSIVMMGGNSGSSRSFSSTVFTACMTVV